MASFLAVNAKLACDGINKYPEKFGWSELGDGNWPVYRARIADRSAPEVASALRTFLP
jgi:hypothetical protein